FRGDAVDPDAVRARLGCGVFGEEFDAGFGGGVGDWGAWVWAARGGRRDGDDVSVSSLLHPGEEALDRQEGRGQVGIDGCAPVVFADLLERGGPEMFGTHLDLLLGYGGLVAATVLGLRVI